MILLIVLGRPLDDFFPGQSGLIFRVFQPLVERMPGTITLNATGLAGRSGGPLPLFHVLVLQGLVSSQSTFPSLVSSPVRKLKPLTRRFLRLGGIGIRVPWGQLRSSLKK